MMFLEKPYPRRRMLGQIGWFLLWLGTYAFALYLTPSTEGHGTHRQLGLPPCPSTLAFDRPCPGCGLTTSFTAMAHLSPIVAFKAHALGPILFVLFTLSALACGYYWLRGIRLNSDTKAFNWALGAIVVVFFAYGAVRFTLSDGYGPKPQRLSLSKR